MVEIFDGEKRGRCRWSEQRDSNPTFLYSFKNNNLFALKHRVYVNVYHFVYQKYSISTALIGQSIACIGACCIGGWRILLIDSGKNHNQQRMIRHDPVYPCPSHVSRFTCPLAGEL